MKSSKIGEDVSIFDGATLELPNSGREAPLRDRLGNPKDHGVTPNRKIEHTWFKACTTKVIFCTKKQLYVIQIGSISSFRLM